LWHIFAAAMLVVAGAFMPLPFIFRRPRVLRQLRQAHWPVLGDVLSHNKRCVSESVDCESGVSSDDDDGIESSVCSKIWLNFVEFANDFTSPCKQNLALYEELPHIIAGIVFLVTSGNESIVVRASLAISALKLIVVLGFRPLALCWRASAGKPWDDVSVWDVSRATSCGLACIWPVRSRAARSLLRPGIQRDIQVAAVEALGNLFAHLIEARDESNEDVDEVLSKEVMKTQALLARLLVADMPLADVAKKALVRMAGKHVEPAAIDAVADRVRLLINPDPMTRLAAAEELATLGDHAAPCVPQLLHGSLWDDDENVRNMMAFAVRTLGSNSYISAAQVARFLGGTDAQIDLCCAALEAIGCMSEHGAPFALRITELLEHDDSDIRKCAASALGNLGHYASEAIPQVVTLLDHVAPGVREVSVETLGRLCEYTSQKVVVPKLVTLLDDANPSIRSVAAESLGAYREHAAPFSQRLSFLTDDADSRVRKGAAEALGKIGDDASAFAGKLGKLLQDTDPNVRHAAAHALGEMGDAGAPFASQLAKLLSDTSSDVRCAAVQTLGQLGASASPFAIQIARLLADGDTREAALAGLGWLGDHGKSCAPRLAEFLKDTNPAVRAAAVRGFAELGEHASPFAPQLARLLADTDPDVRDAAAASLSEFGWDGALFAPELAKLLSDTDSQVCYTAIEALGNLGAHAGPYASQLAALLTDPDADIRYAATEAIGCLAVYSCEFVPQVASNLVDEVLGVRYAALEALGKFGAPAAVAFLPNIASLASDADAGVRRGVADALGKFGGHAQPFVHTLQQLKMDEDEFVSKAATASLAMVLRR